MCQHISNQINIKFLNMLFSDINYNKGKSYMFFFTFKHLYRYTGIFLNLHSELFF